MRILVTGSSGYIGSHLVSLLESQGFEVHGLDLEQGVDIMDFTGGLKYDAVVHLAALVQVNGSLQDPVSYYKTNIMGTINILDWCMTKNFIFASTGVASHCMDPYGISKRAAEDCVQQLCKQEGKDYTIFRFYNVIGTSGYPATNPDGLMYNLVNAQNTKEFTIFGDDYPTPDGTCVRDYVHVDEICKSILMAIEEPANGIENLGTGVGISVREMAETFREVNDIDFDIKVAPAREGDLPYTVLDNPSRYMRSFYSIRELLKMEF